MHRMLDTGGIELLLAIGVALLNLNNNLYLKAQEFL